MKPKPTYEELEKELQILNTSKKLIEESSIVHFIWKNEENWPVEYVSENVKQLLGYSVDDFLTNKIVYSKIIHPEDLPRVENEVRSQSKINTHLVERKPYRIISKAGKTKWLNDITHIRRDENNEITHYEGIIIDITEQKEAEQELQNSEVKFRTVAEYTYDWEYWIDNDGKLIYISPSCERITGYRVDEFYSNHKLLREIIHPDDVDVTKENIRKTAEANEIEAINFRIITKNNEERWIGQVCQTVYDKDGVSIGQRGSNRDITAQKQAEKELIIAKKRAEKHEKQLQEAQKTAHLGHWEFDIVNDELIWSDEVYRIFDLQPQEIDATIEAFYDTIHPKDREQVKEAYSNSLVSKMPYEIEHRIILKSGKTKYVSEKCYTEYNKAGEPIRSLGTVLDITKHKENEEALEQRENYLIALNKIAEILLEGSLKIQIQKIIEIIGKVTQASRTYVFENSKNKKGDVLLSQIAEYVAEGIEPEIDNLILQNLPYADWLPRWYKILNKGEIIKGKVEDFPQTEKEILEPQGIKSILIIPIILENEFWGFVGFDNCINDEEWQTTEIEYLKACSFKISSRLKEYRKQLLTENENKRFKATMDSIDAVVYVADMQTHEILFLNRKAKSFLEAKIGDKCSSVLQDGQVELCSFCTNYLLLDEKGKAKEPYIWEFENTITKRWYQCRDQAIRWTDDRLVRIEMATDITESKEAERVLKESEEKLKIANSTKDRFFSIIAHDLRSPFNTILGFANLLMDKDEQHDDQQQEEFINIIAHSASDTLKLLDNLLDWARSQMSEIKFGPKELSVSNIFEQIINQMEDSANQKGILLFNHLEKDITVLADEYMLNTILRNLVSNAIKFTNRNGEIELQINDNKEDFVISVKDSGVGIDDEKQKVIFDLDENITTKGTENEKGTGLGLVLCKEFVDMHGGRIWIESKIGIGTTFYFSIPK